MLALLTTGGCFGDWVNAVPRPKRETLPAPTTAETKEPVSVPDDPCAAYRAEVARRCELVFDGYMGPARCHAHIVRVMTALPPKAAPAKTDAKPDARPSSRAAPGPEVCTQSLRALPEVPAPRKDPAPLGPSCRRWAEQLRERCVTPLSTPRPALGSCGKNLLAYESMLGGITFGRPEQYEPQCKREVERMTRSPTPGSTG